MIRFSLRCARDHTFESWFRDNAAFDALIKDSHVACPVCGSTEVSKALMAPAVVTSRRRSKAEAPASLPAQGTPPADPQPVVLADDRDRMLRSMLRDWREHVVRNTRDVGDAFAAEARRMHGGETEQEAIRGVATRDDVQALVEDGIEIAPLPSFPDDRN